MGNVQWLFSIVKRNKFINKQSLFKCMGRVHIVVHGYVQGIFFRFNTKKFALDLGLKGYAKNLQDGTVEVVAEGPEEKLKELVEFCKRGPELAKVSKIDVKFEKLKNEFEGFEIRY
jgi:acylphosphatase